MCASVANIVDVTSVIIVIIVRVSTELYHKQTASSVNNSIFFIILSQLNAWSGCNWLPFDFAPKRVLKV